MTYGSLFSGIGGLDLALEAFGHTPVWQAESDPYARAVLAKHWPEVRRYNDVREIDHEATPADIICGGFPCQDISLAGAGAGIDGPKSGLWSEFARIVRVLRPSLVFVENVAAILGRGLDRVLGDLAALGFDAEWETVLASDVGAPHRRDRLFLLAYTDRERVRQLAERHQWSGRGARAAERGDAEPIHDREALAHAGGVGIQEGLAGRIRPGGRLDAERGSREEHMADADGAGCSLVRIGRILDGERTAPRNDAHGRHRPHCFPPGPAAISGWDGPQPAIRRGDDGVPGRSHRLRLLGNAVVPQQAALALETLTARARRAASTEAS